MFAIQDLQTDDNKKKTFETFWNNFAFFRTFNLSQLSEISKEFKVVSFKTGTNIIQQGDPVEWMGVILLGTMVGKRGEQVFEILNPGEIIGHMGICEFPNNNRYKFSITATTNGYIAILTLQDIKAISYIRPNIVLYLVI